MTELPRPETPKASSTLFRQIAKIASESPERFSMMMWHQNRGFLLDLKYLERDKISLLHDCGTAHCLAGWIVVLTPGGVELEYWMARQWTQWRGLSWPDVYATCGLSSHWKKDYDSFVSPTALAALSILERAGWHEGLVGAPPFDSSQFYGMTETGLRYLSELERNEVLRFPGTELVA